MLAGVAWRKTSLIDYPGRVAAVLFLPGCNFRCPYCHNAVLVDAGGPAGDELVTLDEVAAFLDRRKALISALVVSGGEPLLHEETRVSRPRRAAGDWRSARHERLLSRSHRGSRGGLCRPRLQDLSLGIPPLRPEAPRRRRTGRRVASLSCAPGEGSSKFA